LPPVRACSGLLIAALSAAQGTAPRVTFHHLHVNDDKPGYLLSYYGRLFDSSTTRPARFGDYRGIEASGVFLLITPVREAPPETGGPGWHFGWGRVTLDEAYDRHRMQEAEMAIPIPSFASGLHLHLESEDPLRAAAWYRDRFDARIAVSARNAEIRPVNDFLRRPAAIVELPGIVFAIYQAVVPLHPSRGQRIDHVAFKADLGAVRRSGAKVLEERGRLGPFETMTVEGPDRLAIELVGAPVLGLGRP
jgi:hypothetical protein